MTKTVLTKPPKIYCLGITLLLHCSLIAPWWLSSQALPAPASQQLVITVVGIIGERQVEASRSERKSSISPVAAVVQHPARQKLDGREKPVPAGPPLKADPPLRENHVVHAPLELPAPPEQAPDPPPSPLATNLERPQQTVRPRSAENNDIRKYVAGLSKAIQDKLIYPSEAREAEYIGAPVIAFTLTEEGQILPGSLHVQRSSGFPVLDESAMHAALASAPFARPPQRMDIAITVSFAQQR